MLELGSELARARNLMPGRAAGSDSHGRDVVSGHSLQQKLR
jgi:hypothetical protein